MIELRGNLFGNPYVYDKSTRIVNCISSDYTVKSGFASEIERRYMIKGYLKMVGKGIYPDVIAVDNIINMITKNKYWDKTTYHDFDRALTMVKDYCVEHDISKLLMPRLGTESDNMDWGYCREGIKYLIEAYDIECTVYSK